jgi:hypothetical protein
MQGIRIGQKIGSVLIFMIVKVQRRSVEEEVGKSVAPMQLQLKSIFKCD